jgi:hypothetical protein
MRIWTVALAWAAVLSGLFPGGLFAQTPKAIAPTVGPAANSATALKQQNVPPNLAVSNATPALGKQGFTPAMPTPGTPALGQGFTTGIGGPRLWNSHWATRKRYRYRAAGFGHSDRSAGFWHSNNPRNQCDCYRPT